MALEGEEFLARRSLPDLHCLVRCSLTPALAVRAERQAKNQTLIAHERFSSSGWYKGTGRTVHSEVAQASPAALPGRRFAQLRARTNYLFPAHAGPVRSRMHRRSDSPDPAVCLIRSLLPRLLLRHVSGESPCSPFRASAPQRSLLGRLAHTASNVLITTAATSQARERRRRRERLLARVGEFADAIARTSADSVHGLISQVLLHVAGQSAGSLIPPRPVLLQAPHHDPVQLTLHQLRQLPWLHPSAAATTGKPVQPGEPHARPRASSSLIRRTSSCRRRQCSLLDSPSGVVAGQEP